MKNSAYGGIIVGLNIEIPKWLRKFADANEEPLYLVGGYVRNALCGLPPSDIDLAGRSLSRKLTLPKGFFFATVYKRTGTALIKHRYIKNAEIEYTPFRTEEYASGGGHTPVSVFFDAPIEDDASRRDFTVNSIYYDLKNEKIIDFFGGLEDIERRRLRAHDPEKVFASDGLRLLRLVRIAAETGFEIETATAETAKKCVGMLADISPNRKADELMKMLVADTKYGVADAHYRALTLMRDYGFLQYVIPELTELDGLVQPVAYHKYDALEHTFRVVKASPPDIRLAALLHDIGKAESIKRSGNMHNHDAVGAELTERILGQQGLRFSNRDIDRVTRLVRLHMFDKSRSTRDRKMLIFAARNADIIEDLSALMDADSIGKGMSDTPEPNRLLEFYEKFKSSGAPRSLSALKINGTDLMSLGYRGDGIKKKLSELYDECVSNPSLNTHKTLMRLAKTR